MRGLPVSFDGGARRCGVRTQMRCGVCVGLNASDGPLDAQSACCESITELEHKERGGEDNSCESINSLRYRDAFTKNLYNPKVIMDDMDDLIALGTMPL
jgi:hypothetical protein